MKAAVVADAVPVPPSVVIDGIPSSSTFSKCPDVNCDWDSTAHWKWVLGRHLISPRAARREVNRSCQDRPVGFQRGNKVYSVVIEALKDKECNPDQRLFDFLDSVLSCKSKQHFNDARRAEL